MNFLLLFAAVAFVVALPHFAFAQDSAVELDPFFGLIRPYVDLIVNAIIGAVITWAAYLLQRWTGIQVEAKHREALHSALSSGAKKMVTKITPTGVKIDVKNPAWAEGINYVIKSVPDARDFFGLTEDRIKAMLETKLADITPEPPALIMGEVLSTDPSKKAAKK